MRDYNSIEDLQIEFGQVWTIQIIEITPLYQCDLNGHFVRYHPSTKKFTLHSLCEDNPNRYSYQFICNSEDEVHIFIKSNTKLKNFK